jgi:Ca2+-binding RTX toxin-like protein
MATINWSTLANGQTIAFDPANDVLRFDSASISASSLSFTAFGNPAVVSVGGVSVTLQAPFAALTSSNVTFADGSLFLVGDNTTGTVNDDNAQALTGGVGNDFLAGLNGNDTLNGGAGVDTAVFRGASSGYAFSRSGDRIIVTDTDTAALDEGADRLSGIEAIRFTDGTVRLGSAGEFRVNGTTASDQSQAVARVLSDGGLVIAWASANQDGSTFGIYAQRFDAAGVATGPEFRVNTVTFSDQIQPTVAALPAGGFVVAWASLLQDGSNYGIYAQRYDAAGATVGSEFRVNTTTAGLQIAPAITALSDGSFVVTWQSNGQDGAGSLGVAGQRYDAAGVAQGIEFLVNTTTAGDQVTPAIATLAGGGLVVAWTSSGQDGSGQGIYAQRLDAQGTKVGGEFLVNTFTAGNQQIPEVAALAGGGFVIAWTSAGQDGSGDGVYAQRYDASGAALGSEFRVNTTTTDEQRSPALSALNGGGFVVAWQSFAQDGASFGVYAQRYDANGVAVGGEFLVNATTADFQDTPSVTGLADGGFLIAWQSNTQDGDGYGIYARRYSATGESVGATLTGDAGANWLAWSGSDAVVIDGAGGGDTLIGGSGNDNFVGGDGADVIVAEGGNDSVVGGIGNDSIDGRSGNDTLYGNEDVDIMFGDAGDDLIYGGDSGDVLMGERGGASTVGGNDTIYGDADPLLLTGGDDLIDGDAGDDVIYGGGGNDVILGDNGNDTITGGAGAEIMGGSAASIASIETTGNDTFVYRAMTDAGDTIYGFDVRGGNNDVIDIGPLLESLGYFGTTPRTDGYLRVEQSGGNVLVQIDTDGAANGSAFTTLLTLFDRNAPDIVDGFFLSTVPLTGTANAAANLLVGNGQANVIQALAGNDTVEGRDGNDTLYGDEGADLLSGEGGNDVLLGGADGDTISGAAGNDLVVGEGGSDSIDGGLGNDSLDGGAGNDTIHGNEEVDIVFGDAGSDVLHGGTGSDVIMGERGGASVTGGNDTLYGDLDALSLSGGDDQIDGDAGDDLIYGGGGNDVILGDNGNDTIEGGAGADIIGGSAASLAGIETTGNDTFVYRAMTDAGDSIYGFDVRGGDSDAIDLRLLFDALGYAGTAPRTDGYLQVVQSGGDVLVQVDANGSTGGASFVTLATLVDRTATDITDGYFLFQ